MTRFLAPAGMPLQVSDFVAGARAWLNPAADGIQSMAAYTGARHVFGTASARAGMVVVFRALRRLAPERTVVAIPGYTCYSVAAAAVRAGLKIYPLEMNPGTLDIDYEKAAQAPHKQLLAVLTANLFGFASDVRRLKDLTAGTGALVIDDAAQSLGTCTNGQLSGCGADVGLYSLARGKALPVGGGIVVTDRDELAAEIARELQSVPFPSATGEVKAYLELLGVSLLFRPWLYWIPNRLPFLKLGVTEFDPDFPVTQMTRVSAGMLPGRMAQLPELTAARTAKAARLRKSMREVTGFLAPEAPAGCRPSYIRFPLLASDRGARDRAVRELNRAGIGATAYYPAAVCDIPGIGPHLALAARRQPGAEEVANRILTLPLHPMVQDADLDEMAAILKRCSN